MDSTLEASSRPQPDASISDKIAAQSYTNTLKRLEREFADDPKALKILTSFESTHTLEVNLENLKKTCKGRDRRRQSTLQWLNRISARILHYERALDILAQHHAEYVSLVWGSIKFVLVGIVNYAELVEEFGVAWTQIGDILHDTKLDLHLHETPRILCTYSEMCSHIIEFLFRAVRWCRRSTASRVIHSIVNPWELGYKDILTNIRACSKTINDLSSAESRLEIRRINKNVRTLQTDYQSLQTVLDDIQHRLGVNEGALDAILKTVTANKSISERVNYHIQEIKPSIYAIEVQLQRFVEGGNDPDMTLQKAHAATLRRQRCSPCQPSARVVSLMSRWTQASNHSLLILQSSTRTRDIAKDLSVNTILQLQKAKYNVLWVFRQRTKDDPSEGVADVLKSLIYQIVARDPQTTLDFPRPLHIFQEKSNCTLKELEDLLCTLLSRLGSCFIIVESQYFRNSQLDIHVLCVLKQLTQSVNQNFASVVKVMFLGGNDLSSPAWTEDGNERQKNSSVVARVQPPQPLPTHLRRVRRKLLGPQIVRANGRIPDGDVYS